MLKPYLTASYTDWRKDIAVLSDGDTASGQIGQEWIAADDPRYTSCDFSQPIQKEIEVPYTYTYVFGTIAVFLDSGASAEREYLIRLNQYLWEDGRYTGNDAHGGRDAKLREWCNGNLPNAQVIEKIGYIRWNGTPEQLLQIASASCTLYVCFLEDFANIHGMSIEKAQAMIDAGELDIWSCPIEGSPLYGKTPAEIAAYLAAQS